MGPTFEGKAIQEKFLDCMKV